MDIQHEIQWFMRPYLIDFLVEAHAAFQLLPETLFLTINLLDRYCSRRVVYKRHYQLVGCAALLIAAKYGDRKERVPLIKELKSMCCSLYDEDMFTQMEWHVLNTLEWVIGHPTVDCFVRLALIEDPPLLDAPLEHMAWYLAEIASYHKEFVSKKPSVMAAVTLALARAILGQPDDMDIYGLETRQTIFELSQKVDCPSQVLQRKYSSSRFSRVANILDHFLREQEEIQRSPSSPAIESTSALSAKVPDANFNAPYPGTPRKQPYLGSMVNGYLTPPITPASDFFLNKDERHNNSSLSPCPKTPSSSESCSYPPLPFENQQSPPQWKQNFS